MLDDDVRQVELEVQQAFSNLQQGRELIQSQEKNVEQANEALRLASARLGAGAGTQLEVLDARVQLTTAHRHNFRRSTLIIRRLPSSIALPRRRCNIRLGSMNRPTRSKLKTDAAPTPAPKPTPIELNQPQETTRTTTTTRHSTSGK